MDRLERPCRVSCREVYRPAAPKCMNSGKHESRESACTFGFAADKLSPWEREGGLANPPPSFLFHSPVQPLFASSLATVAPKVHRFAFRPSRISPRFIEFIARCGYQFALLIARPIIETIADAPASVILLFSNCISDRVLEYYSRGVG